MTVEKQQSLRRILVGVRRQRISPETIVRQLQKRSLKPKKIKWFLRVLTLVKYKKLTIVQVEKRFKSVL